MKGHELETIAVLSNAAAALFNTSREAPQKTAKLLLEKIESTLSPQAADGCDHAASCAEITSSVGTADSAEAIQPGTTIIPLPRLEYLESVEQELIRLSTLIDLHDKAVVIGANGATNELGNEISAIISKHKRA